LKDTNFHHSYLDDHLPEPTSAIWLARECDIIYSYNSTSCLLSPIPFVCVWQREWSLSAWWWPLNCGVGSIKCTRSHLPHEGTEKTWCSCSGDPKPFARLSQWLCPAVIRTPSRN
jgi:hypothetical protein